MYHTHKYCLTKDRLRITVLCYLCKKEITMEDVKMVDTPLADKELKRYFEDVFFSITGLILSLKLSFGLIWSFSKTTEISTLKICVTCYSLITCLHKKSLLILIISY